MDPFEIILNACVVTASWKNQEDEHFVQLLKLEFASRLRILFHDTRVQRGVAVEIDVNSIHV